MFCAEFSPFFIEVSKVLRLLRKIVIRSQSKIATASQNQTFGPFKLHPTAPRKYASATANNIRKNPKPPLILTYPRRPSTTCTKYYAILCLPAAHVRASTRLHESAVRTFCASLCQPNAHLTGELLREPTETKPGCQQANPERTQALDIL